MLDISNHFDLNSPPDLCELSKIKRLKKLYRLRAVTEIVKYTCGRFGEMFRYNVAHVLARNASYHF